MLNILCSCWLGTLVLGSAIAGQQSVAAGRPGIPAPQAVRVQAAAGQVAPTIRIVCVPAPPSGESAKSVVESVEKAITAGGVIFGVVWGYFLFVKRRQKYPRAKMSHRVVEIPLLESLTLLHIDVVITNLGEVLIRLINGYLLVLVVTPCHQDISATLLAGGDPVDHEDNRIKWPKCERRVCNWTKIPREIEPSESDAFGFDVVVDSSTRVVQVYSHFVIDAKRSRGAIRWLSDLLKSTSRSKVGWDLATFLKISRSEIGWNRATFYELKGKTVIPPELDEAADGEQKQHHIKSGLGGE